MGSQERRERERGELRDKIVTAARELFAEKGVEAVTMRAVADRIEYTATALYGHFADKNALLHAIVTEDFLLFAKQFHSIEAIEDPALRLRAAAHAYVRFGLGHPNHYRLMFMTPLPEISPGIRRGACAEDAYAFLQKMVADAKSSGALRPELEDLELVCQLYFTTLHGIVSMHVAMGEGGHSKASWIEWRPVDTLVELACEGLFAATLTEEARARIKAEPFGHEHESRPNLRAPAAKSSKATKSTTKKVRRG
jgi:AcrR family transcriptional regulator